MHPLLRYRLKRLKRGTLAKLALLSPKFSPLLGRLVPLVQSHYLGSRTSNKLVVFLPGIDDLAEDFEHRGFIDDMRRREVHADAVAIDAHYGYYAQRAFLDRMTDDVITLAHAAGYRHIWLAGISLGGFGAASYAARHPSRITGLILLAPYLGTRILIKEIVQAGGIKNWEPGHVGDTDYPRILWRWFKKQGGGDQSEIPIYLGYGSGDRFATANDMLATALPQEHVLSIPGGHNWHTWKKIWKTLLSRFEMHLH